MFGSLEYSTRAAESCRCPTEIFFYICLSHLEVFAPGPQAHTAESLLQISEQ